MSLYDLILIRFQSAKLDALPFLSAAGEVRRSRDGVVGTERLAVVQADTPPPRFAVLPRPRGRGRNSPLELLVLDPVRVDGVGAQSAFFVFFVVLEVAFEPLHV